MGSSGSPFNITVPDDVNGDSIFNDRPGLVSRTTCPGNVIPTAPSTIYCSPLGTFNAAGAVAGVPLVPINYGTGPAHFVLNLRMTKTFGFGAKTKESSSNVGGPGGPGGHGGGGGHGPRGPLFGGGPMMGGGSTDRRYNLTLGVNVRNVFNKVNLANPSGVLGGPPSRSAGHIQFLTANTGLSIGSQPSGMLTGGNSCPRIGRINGNRTWPPWECPDNCKSTGYRATTLYTNPGLGTICAAELPSGCHFDFSSAILSGWSELGCALLRFMAVGTGGLRSAKNLARCRRLRHRAQSSHTSCS